MRLARERHSYRNDPAVPGFPDDHPIIVFDGHCALCSGWAEFVLRHDHHGTYRLLPAQSPLGRALYVHYGLDPDDYETNILIADGVAWFEFGGQHPHGGGLGLAVVACCRIPHLAAAVTRPALFVCRAQPAPRLREAGELLRSQGGGRRSISGMNNRSAQGRHAVCTTTGRHRAPAVAARRRTDPALNSYEFAQDGRFHFHVEIGHPLTGLIVRYRGWLVPQT